VSRVRPDNNGRVEIVTASTLKQNFARMRDKSVRLKQSLTNIPSHINTQITQGYIISKISHVLKGLVRFINYDDWWPHVRTTLRLFWGVRYATNVQLDNTLSCKVIQTDVLFRTYQRLHQFGRNEFQASM
jgi:hypothetical protein